jgi:CRP-like cAMP-binding protein
MAVLQPLDSFPRSTAPQSQNRLLAALPRDEYERLLPTLESVAVVSKQVLQRQGEEIERVFFPGRGTCSVVEVMQDGLTIEVGMIGPEGMTGVGVLPHCPISPIETRVQIGDEAMQVINVDAFHHEITRRGRFSELVHRYTQAFLRLAMQSCACNGLHSVDERCCRWLLMAHDRTGRYELPVTQDSLAAALGVRRPTITLTINALRHAGLIGHGHRKITILNRKGLEAAACECYQAARLQFDQVMAT